MKIIAIISIVIFCFVSCNKDKNVEYVEYVSESINGKVFYIDSINGFKDTIFLKNTDVFLTNDLSTQSFIISTKTDSTGTFVFKAYPKNINNIYLFAKFDKNNLNYFGIYPLIKDNSNLIKLDLVKNPGMWFKTQTSSGNVLPYVTVYLFTNEFMRNSIDTAHVAFVFKTNAQGLNWNNQLFANTRYYVYAINSINGQNYSVKTDFFYDGNNLNPQNQILTLTADIQQSNILNIYTIDSLAKSPLGNINICIFNNRTFAIRDTLYKNCQGASYNSTTDVHGKSTVTGLQAGRYYFTVHDSVAGLLLFSLDSLDYTPGSIASTKRIGVVIR